ncbi:nuclear transport factor 2 family protein [uncultured Roseobacter sp.]|uniref:nuclear transport factor 2 family protein n=1 Tax=uncultured Roseobacter sp. TaxID=114847 RepID=UPI002628A253|nr:nuclear transport factor 2 family protein [uncultured Roseobacter sp.]
MRLDAFLTAALIATTPLPAWSSDTHPQKEHTEMTPESAEVQQVRKAIDDLIQTATSYDVEVLDRIYHDRLHVVMIDSDHNLNTADKATFKDLFAAKRDAGDPPMNTWAKYHSIDVSEDTAHVLLSRKNDLSGVDMDLTLSIDLIFEDDRWQVTREVIFLRPDGT